MKPRQGGDSGEGGTHQELTATNPRLGREGKRQTNVRRVAQLEGQTADGTKEGGRERKGRRGGEKEKVEGKKGRRGAGKGKA